jgi:hypothetical protein
MRIAKHQVVVSLLPELFEKFESKRLKSMEESCLPNHL